MPILKSSPELRTVPRLSLALGLIAGLVVLAAPPSAAATDLVLDINVGTAGSSPESLTNMNGTLFFTATNGTSGRELWSSGCSPACPELVEDIFPGDVGSDPQELTIVQSGASLEVSTLFFTATNGTEGVELWKSDGTEAGTVLVKNINPGTAGSPSGTASSNPADLTNVNGTLFFTADDGTTGRELWQSDGTEAGTKISEDINPLPRDRATAASPSGTEGSNPAELTNVSGTLFFTADDGTNGVELWKSDGTEVGTVLVKNIYVEAVNDPPSTAGSNPAFLTNVNGTLFFAADDGTNGEELWKSDGTQNGTVLVKDINPGLPSARIGGVVVDPSDPSPGIFFTATDGATGLELWKSDGTAAGTVLVKDINPGGAGSSPGLAGTASFAARVGTNTLFFSADDDTTGDELWKSDGTAAGTVLVKDINPGGAGSSPRSLIIGDTLLLEAGLFFSADDGTNGVELWKSDGTEAGTMLVTDINPGAASSDPGGLTLWCLPDRCDGTLSLFFSATDGATGVELWKSDEFAASPTASPSPSPSESVAPVPTPIVVGPGKGMAPRVKILDAEGKTLHSFLAYERTFEGGVTVATTFDLDANNDGDLDVLDIIITAPGPGRSPLVKVFDTEGNQLNSFLAYPKSFRGGVFVAAGDTNGDGVAEIITGPGRDSVRGGRVKVFDGNGEMLRSFLPYSSGFSGGVRVATGDVNNDGVVDIITGSGPGMAPRVKAFDTNSAELDSFLAYRKSFRGGVFVGAGDVNGDGVAEIITGPGRGMASRVNIYDRWGIVEYNPIMSFLAYGKFQGGVHVAVGDLDGDGRSEVITGPGEGISPRLMMLDNELLVVIALAYSEDFRGGVYPSTPILGVTLDY